MSTDIACAALNEIKMGDKTGTVMRALQCPVHPKLEQEEVLLHPPTSDSFGGGTPTKIVCLTQVFTVEKLGDDEEYKNIMEELRQEGNLVNVVIPRPNQDHDPLTGVGKVFLEYADVDGASKAKSAMKRKKIWREQCGGFVLP